MTAIEAHLDTKSGRVFAGTAQINRRRGVDLTEFIYAEEFMAGAGWDLSPDLAMIERRIAVDGLPGALADSAPDAWGRNLIRRNLAAQARDAGHPTLEPTEVDFLLGVDDVTRQGALRFRSHSNGPFLAHGAQVPPLIEVDKLLDATQRIDGQTDDADKAVRILLAAGSGSLGGARPKASVVDSGILHIAKFPQADDLWDVIRWEAVALDLAERCGLDVPNRQLLEIGPEPVLLLERFDRDNGHRVPYLSGRSLIGAPDGTVSDYLELVDGITAHGSAVAADLIELWRRIAFSIVIHNVDDHMRNHAVLRSGPGWVLSPLFDVNPDRRVGLGRVTPIAGATDSDTSRTALMRAAPHFGLRGDEADLYWAEIIDRTAVWRDVAADRGITAQECETFAPVLDRWRNTA